jgi:hypothetical protein
MPNYRWLRILLSLLAVSLVAGAWGAPKANASSPATGFRPVNPEELKMTSEPAAPGAPAIILYRELYRDDNAQVGHEDNYYRIKILTEEGRKYGDVEIPFYSGSGNVVGVHARTIKPDGTIVDFDGKVFTKSLVKAREEKYLAKTFTLPAVQVGCVIEYFYTLDLQENLIFDSHWILSNELFTKAASFSLKPHTSSYRSWYWRYLAQNMPPGEPAAEKGPDGILRLKVINIPAFPEEDFMPPADELKARVDFTYSLDEPEPDANRFWAKVGKRLDGNLESFIGKRKAMEEAVSEIVGPNDPPEVKLQKIYARVQQMRNTSYEVRKTEEEEKREKEKPPMNVEEVWKRGYADGGQLTWLYLALVRAAGFEAYGVLAADRENYFFNPTSLQSERLDSNLVLIKLNGKNIFCDPGAAYTPYGLLPWMETGVQGLQLDKKDSAWIQTLTPASSQARTERRANLTLSESGDLEGRLTVTYTDMEAARLRRLERNADKTERKTNLENILKGYIPLASEVKLANQPEWKDSALPLVAEFDLKVPGWAAGAGRRLILPVGLFSAREKHIFDHAERVHPIYFEYPYAESDDINIQLPAGWRVSNLPHGWQDSGKVVTYSLTLEDNKEKVHLARNLTVEFILMESKYYPALRDYFQQIKTSDDEQIVLEPSPARAGN